MSKPAQTIALTVVSLLPLFLAHPVRAQEAAVTANVPPRPGWRAEAALEDRWLMQSVSPVDVGRPLASDSMRLGRDISLEHRLRTGGRLGWLSYTGLLNQFEAEVQADLFASPLWRNRSEPLLKYDGLASRSDDPLASDKHMLRRFSASFTTRYGRLLLGRTTSQWGLGLFAQDGEPEPWQFGVKRAGSVVDRAQFATMPAAWSGDPRTATPLYVVLSADRVVFDGVSELAKGDESTNLVAALLYRSKTLELGAYGVRRQHEDEQGLTIDAWVGDLYGLWRGEVGAYALEAAAEWLLISGETTYFRTLTNPEKLHLLQHGGVGRVEARRGRAALRLSFGYASGDDNPFDDTLRNLKLSGDHRVGLVLFGEATRRLTATGAHNLSDPRFTGGAPTGFERSVSDGAATQAVWIHPVVRFEPVTGVTLLGGALWARAPVPLVDPYMTSIHGGEARNQRGGKAGQDLGLELDGALRFEHGLGAGLALVMRVDGGVWLPGDAYDDEDGRPAAAVGVAMGQVLLTGKW